MTIQDKLRRVNTHINPAFPGKLRVLMNTDGPEAADYIDNALKHIGLICMIAFRHIDDHDVREEIRKHAFAAKDGRP